MNDFAVVNKRIINGNAVIDFDVYSHIVIEHFGGEECDGRRCQSVRERKRRRRRRGRGRRKESQAESESQTETATSSSSSSLLHEMDRIHCAVLHAYQSAYKLYGNEREQVASVMRAADEDNNNNNNFAYDAQADSVRRLIGSRIMEREDEEQKHMQSINL